MPVNAEWQKHKPAFDDVAAHLKSGGRLGVIPKSLTCIVIDVDRGGDDAKNKVVSVLGDPIVAHKTGTADHWHLWYRFIGDFGKKPFEHGDIICGSGFVVIWG